MLSGLSLRLRIFLFFCLLALGGLAITAGGLIAGYQRAGQPELFDAYVFSGLIIGFLVLALVTGVWLLFDENVAKPIERLAAELRVRAHSGVAGQIDMEAAKYLGDLAPAANAIAGQLAQTAEEAATSVATQTARLAAEKDRLTALLSEIPVAMIMVNPAHQIVLYDAQSAAVLAQVAHPRLNASLFDYFEAEALQTAYARLIKTGKEVTATLKGTDGAQSYDAVLKPLGDAPGYMLVIDAAHAQIAPDAARPLIYDFDLLYAETPAAFDARPLKDLCFVVFDSETTGLLPHKDEVVQIGAVRVLKGRIIEGEVFDTLVDPGRPIPKASSEVHKITDAMVQGAPDMISAGRSFHSFCRDAVIVAHNAPFDMAFLHRYGPKMGCNWDHPILDTVLLSAVLFGASATHTLDAVGERLGVTIPDALRHTALGDARATAEVLCRMLPMLEARGLTTFGAVIAETRKHGRLLEDLN
ncbi:3'-5' exonuclease [Aestuariivita boseongensis]|uniref:3'-5' exonuclease n=1 Tax=Aestuariivita boseongensis TaxID=1470562 RepID=UPI000681CF1F|nr:exonuclease domain-containing protein [Aestuariivita boseongensis]